MPNQYPGVTTVASALDLGTAEWLSYWFDRSETPADLRARLRERFPSMGYLALNALINRATQAALAGETYESEEGLNAPIDPTLPAGAAYRVVVEAEFTEDPGIPIRTRTIDLSGPIDWADLRRQAEEDILRAAQIAMLRASGRRCGYIDLSDPTQFNTPPTLRVLSVWSSA